MSSVDSHPTLLQLIQRWPVAISLVENLPLGDLLNLSRSNSEIRAIFHDFNSYSNPRDLYIGQHQTTHWRWLKHSAIWSCSSPTHTKGSKVNYCRQCSDPICEACIVKSSIGKSENTFKNRCRYLCKDCWAADIPHKRRKFTWKTNYKRQLYNFPPGEGEFCMCTSKDGWLCVKCKEQQNKEAKADGFRVCVGEGCDTILEEDKDRRRICLWCDLPMVRGRASMESKAAFDQRLIDVRINDLQELAANPQEQSGRSRAWVRDPISRRQLRGPEAVEDDKDADKPQFLKNLDVINYRRFGAIPPDGEYVFKSFNGIFKYDRMFLMQFRSIMRHPTALGQLAAERLGIASSSSASTSEAPGLTENSTSESDSDQPEDAPRKPSQTLERSPSGKRQKMSDTEVENEEPAHFVSSDHELRQPIPVRDHRRWAPTSDLDLDMYVDDDPPSSTPPPENTTEVSFRPPSNEYPTFQIRPEDAPPAYDEI